ncbi:hypothetical protein F66182_18381, partial [Fusarium sp. NRRL 66182]
MEQMRREIESMQHAPQRTGSPGWAAEFDGEQARMEAAFQGPNAAPAALDSRGGPGFSAAEFSRFQQQHRTASPITQSTQSPMMSGYQRPMMGGYMGAMGGMGAMGMMGPSYMPMQQQQQQQPAAQQQDGKGKGRMVELDDENWEAQFAEMDAAGQEAFDDQANQAMEAELNDLD